MRLFSEPAKNFESVYRKEDGYILIEIKLSSVVQLFNSFDPAPFREKELDKEAEEYIVDSVNDFPAKTRFKIVVYLPPELLSTERAQKIPEAIRNHFAYLALEQNRALRSRYLYGRFTIIVGLTALAVSLFTSTWVAESLPDSPVALLVANALEVAGWVAMWEPVTVLLYQLWPIIKERKMYEMISRLEIVIRPHQP